MQFTIKGGIKYKKKRLRNLPLPAFSPSSVEIYISDADVLCSIGEDVRKGQVIAHGGLGGATYYSSVSGNIIGVGGGFVTVKTDTDADGETLLLPEYSGSFDTHSREEIIRHLLLSQHPDSVEVACRYEESITEKIIINCISDPCSEDAEKIIGGAKILLCALGIRSAVLAISKDNKKFARAVERQSYPREMFLIAMLPVHYPLEFPETITKAVFPYSAPEKCFVISHLSCIAAYDAFVGSIPCLSHDLNIVYKNRISKICCPVGTTVGQIISYYKANALKKELELCAVTGICGLGIDLDNDQILGNDITSITLKKVSPSTAVRHSGCIACSKCHHVCPMGLFPQLIASGASTLGIDKCIGCGCCSLSCPVGIDLSSLIKKAAQSDFSNVQAEASEADHE